MGECVYPYQVQCMTVTNELVQIFTKDGEKVGILYQNGQIEMYTLKKATKQDVQELLETSIMGQVIEK